MTYATFVGPFRTFREPRSVVRLRRCPLWRSVREDCLLELGNAAGNTGPNSAERDFEDISDLLIRTILQIEEAEGRPVWFLDLAEEFEHPGCIKRVDYFR